MEENKVPGLPAEQRFERLTEATMPDLDPLLEGYPKAAAGCWTTGESSRTTAA